MYISSSIDSLDKPLVARTLRTLLTVSTLQVDLPVHGLYIFYSQAFSNIRYIWHFFFPKSNLTNSLGSMGPVGIIVYLMYKQSSKM